MGLGKTIQTLALIITRPRKLEEGQKYFEIGCSKATLLVVPLALADQWRREIVEKTQLRVYVHHGPKRETDPYRISKYDVVITTYDTVSSEWYQTAQPDPESKEPKGRGIFRINWWRIVLGYTHPSLI